ncbi:glycolate oxidase subunit GlcE [Castellaniella sp. S9]|uniref:glycolate oxidase subunit GlcE n=1 Tax=Castellaniella sp. S9 TaxID=2993652 RepID=UPI0022B526CC|nr:glycolate oxidase subunit GlcE [Castellaniella sp. S9]
MDFVLSEFCDRVATARAAQRPVHIRGGGTRMFYGEPAVPEGPERVCLDVSGYHGIIGYEPSELVITARAGTRLADIEQTLAERGQMLAFEPPRFGPEGTLGGCVASGLSGPRRMAAGPLSDFVLGTRLLDANGNVLRFGGEVMKNVAGYDVSRLLAGSLGVLGAIIEVSLKVVPRPRRETTRVLQADEAQALALCVRWRAQPLPVSATAWVADAGGAGGRLYVRLSGNESAVAQAGAAIGGDALDAPADAEFWRALRDQTHPFFGQRPLWRVAVPPPTPPLGLGPTLVEWQGGLRWVAAPLEAGSPLRARVQSAGGSACLYRHDGETGGQPVFHPLEAGVLQIHRRLKHEFDPSGLFNPHRLYPEF